ncbi:Bifunctional glutathionylspermidine synthetase/amidase [Raoultella planticola]|uniref:Bifunctional glutathionylspermidine synthetase/amidase n=1 Tax=Raoultella planticola TaxID=575 RepID=A0A485BNT8_RAOPL|nr:Bifunctional glutathionylspermidine synthetase/amidase [Raoultella planticola]
MGHKWQCVEFARRFLFLTYGFVFTDVGMAYEIFSLRFLREVVNDNILPLQAFANGARRPPDGRFAADLAKGRVSSSIPAMLR